MARSRGWPDHLPADLTAPLIRGKRRPSAARLHEPNILQAFSRCTSAINAVPTVIESPREKTDAPTAAAPTRSQYPDPPLNQGRVYLKVRYRLRHGAAARPRSEPTLSWIKTTRPIVVPRRALEAYSTSRAAPTPKA